MDGRHAAIGAVVVLAVAGRVLRSRRGSGAGQPSWTVDGEFDARRHCDRFFDMDSFELREQVEWWDADELYGDQDYLDERAVERYMARIRRGERVIPVFVEEDGRIKDGHHRWEAAKRLGLERVPVYVLDYGW